MHVSAHICKGCHSNIRSATEVKVGQDRFSTLTIDFWWKLVLTVDLIPFIFTIFSCTICVALIALGKQFDRCSSSKISPVHWPFTLTTVPDCSTVAIGVTPFLYLRQDKHVHMQNANSLRVHMKKIACNTQHAFNFWLVCTILDMVALTTYHV